MDASQWYLLVSVFGAAWTAAAWFGARHVSQAPFYFMMSWLAGELALFHIGWQAAATVGFAAFGGLQGSAGALGLAVSFVSWAALVQIQRRAGLAGPSFGAALTSGLGANYQAEIPAERRSLLRTAVVARDWRSPFSFKSDAVKLMRGIAYGPAGKRNTLDVFIPRNLSAEQQGKAPVLLQIHGGAWVMGSKDQQARPLMTHLAERGWVCVAINYRLSPKTKFPDHLIDAKRAMKWIRENIAEYGGDPNYVAVTGGSAGGHLSSLFALTANDPQFQPGFEDVDTSVRAAVPFYGIYDFADRENVRGRSPIVPFLQKYVMPVALAKDPDLWDQASPVCQVSANAPPLMAIHGDYDALAFVEDARLFVTALRSVSAQPVVYAEIPYAQHAFDIFHSERSAQAVNAVTQFLEWVRARDGHS
ncbi:MAG: alpha/beta hydrolase [Myxococcota bacterium]|nr:alpha/beta hydrolase [Myxococcota bacterium]